MSFDDQIRSACDTGTCPICRGKMTGNRVWGSQAGMLENHYRDYATCSSCRGFIVACYGCGQFFAKHSFDDFSGCKRCGSDDRSSAMLVLRTG